jgi:hypothetical protein
MMSSVEAQPVTPLKANSQPLLAGSGGRRLRRLWLRLLMFFSPIVLIVAPTIYWIDPFDLFHNNSPLPPDLRYHYAKPINQTLWKVLAFNRDPKPNVLLGDSQVAQLPEGLISSLTGEPYANLGAGGATLREKMDMFWFASRKLSLKHVYFEVNFIGYNAYPTNRVPQAEGIVKVPVLYVLNSDVLEAGAYDIADAVFHHRTNLGTHLDRDAFWRIQLQSLTRQYKRDADPGSLRDQLRAIVKYSREHGIAFVFVIPPQHMDAQRRVPELGVEDQYEQFKNDLAGMATVYDCDIDSSFTRDKNNFSDPFHLEDRAANQLVTDLWSGHPTLCRTLGSK